MEIRRWPLRRSGNRQAPEEGAAAPAVTGKDDRPGLGLSWKPECPGGAAQAPGTAEPRAHGVPALEQMAALINELKW